MRGEKKQKYAQKARLPSRREMRRTESTML
jgi:hypothetical protein